jgi:hypothetical protein
MKDININISPVTFNKFLSDGISVKNIGSGIILLKALKDNNLGFIKLMYKQKEEMEYLVKDLYIHGFLKLDNDENNKIVYSLTNRSIDLLHFLEIKNKGKDNKQFDEINDWIQDWLNIWKNQNGVFYAAPSDNTDNKKRTLGCSKKDALDRMKDFYKHYSDVFEDVKDISPKDIIFLATKKYLAEFKTKNFMYCRKAVYFIFKKEDTVTSDLSTWCLQTIQELKTKNINELNEKTLAILENDSSISSSHIKSMN